MKSDGEAGFEGIKCKEARKKGLGLGKCSRIPPIRVNRGEFYLNPYACLPCSWRVETTARMERTEQRNFELKRMAELELESKSRHASLEEEKYRRLAVEMIRMIGEKRRTEKTRLLMEPSLSLNTDKRDK